MCFSVLLWRSSSCKTSRNKYYKVWCGEKWRRGEKERRRKGRKETEVRIFINRFLSLFSVALCVVCSVDLRRQKYARGENSERKRERRRKVSSSPFSFLSSTLSPHTWSHMYVRACRSDSVHRGFSRSMERASCVSVVRSAMTSLPLRAFPHW